VRAQDHRPHQPWSPLHDEAVTAMLDIFKGQGCALVTLIDPEFDVVALADRQTVQRDLTPSTRQLWIDLVEKFPGQIDRIGGVGDSAHAKRKSCHNVLRDAHGKVIEGAKALDVQPIGTPGTAAFIALGKEQLDWIWANRASNGCTVQIFRRRIRSIYKKNGAWRVYLGPNGHFKHHHNSVRCAG